MAKILLGFFIALILVAVAGSAYYFGQNNRKDATSVVTTKVSSSTPTPTPTATEDKPIPLKERPTAGMVNPSATIAVIDDAFAKNDKSLGLDLGGWMTEKVSVTLYATECCGVKTRKEASVQLDNSVKTATGTWDCTDVNPIAKTLREKDPGNFKDDVICTSTDRKTFGFHLDDQFLIDRYIFLADYKQITG